MLDQFFNWYNGLTDHLWGSLLLFAVGGVCFGCSDNILLAFCYGNKRTWDMNIWVHIIYYAAHLLIAWSILAI